MRKILLGVHLASLLAAAFWAVVWPFWAGFDATGDAVHAGFALTLAAWVGSMAGLCALRVRDSRDG